MRMRATAMQHESRTTDPIVDLRSLCKVYSPTPPWMRMLVRTNIRSDIHALTDVDLRLERGQILAVVGPNGAGKTTMFKTMIGLTTPTSGTARILGYDAHEHDTDMRRRLGWMPAEDRSLFLRLTCWENLFFHGRLQHMPRRRLKARIGEVLAQVGLEKRAQSAAQSLSAGMRARLQLARAILHEPDLLVLDEPTAAVDPVGAHELLALITSLVSDHGLAVLLSSHRLEEIEALQSDVVLLDGGRIRYRGDLGTLRLEWSRPQVELAFGAQAHAHAARELLQCEGSALDGRGDAAFRYPLQPGEHLGAVLVRLGGLSRHLISANDVELPLRDLLAEVYSRSEPRTDPVELSA
jgi:ABC-2 type transport system ATP-binding protein